MRQRKCLPDEQYGKLSRRVKELTRRIDKGTLDFDLAMTHIQQLIEMKGPEYFKVAPHSATFDLLVDYRSPIYNENDRLDDNMKKILDRPLHTDHKYEASRVTMQLVSFPSAPGILFYGGTWELIVLGLLKNSLRPATARELLAFRRAYVLHKIKALIDSTYWRSQYPIIALGSLFIDLFYKHGDPFHGDPFFVVPALEITDSNFPGTATLNHIATTNLPDLAHGLHLVVIE